MSSGELMSPIIISSSPFVLTVGARCYHLGYGFVWEHCRAKPWFTLPDDTRLDLRSGGKVPYLVRGRQPYVWNGGSDLCRNTIRLHALALASLVLALITRT